MELEKQVHVIDDIRGELVSRTETRVKVRANMGRSKIVESEGLLIQAHPSLFVLEVDRRRGRTARQSYQYVDVLTGMVELFDTETGMPIFTLGREHASFEDASDAADDEDDE